MQGPAHRPLPDRIADLGQFASQQWHRPPRGLMAVRLGIGRQQGLQHRLASRIQLDPPPTVRGVAKPRHPRLSPGGGPGLDAGAAAVQALGHGGWTVTGRQQVHRLLASPASHARLGRGGSL